MQIKKELPQKILNLLFAGVFLLILVIPTLFPKLGLGGVNENKENRVLAQKPNFILTKESYLNYFSQYESYINDNFGFRDKIIEYNNLLKLRYLKVSPVETVLIGKEDWLFYTGDNVINQYKGKLQYTTEELEKIRVNLEQRKEWLGQQGIPFYIMIAPNKHTIYSEYLPNYIVKENDQTKLDQVIKYLKQYSTIQIIDPSESLEKYKKQYCLYMKNDTHWNTIGGFVAYQELISAINNDPESNINISPLQWEDFNFEDEIAGGDLKNMLGVEEMYDEERQKLVANYDSKVKDFNGDLSHLPNPGSTVIKENTEIESLKLVMFRDSFASAMIPYLSEHFSRSVYVWDHNFNGNIIKDEQSDIVIHELVERYIDVLLSDNIGLN